MFCRFIRLLPPFLISGTGISRSHYSCKFKNPSVIFSQIVTNRVRSIFEGGKMPPKGKKKAITKPEEKELCLSESGNESGPEKETSKPKKGKGRTKITAKVTKPEENEHSLGESGDECEPEKEKSKPKIGKGRTKATGKVTKPEENEHSLSESEPEKEKSKAKKEMGKSKLTAKVTKPEENEHSISESGNESEPEKEKSKPKKEKGKSKVTAKVTKTRGSKRIAGSSDAADSSEVAPKKAKVETEEAEVNFDCDKETPDGKKWNFKISTWNVAGLRAWVKKGGLDYITKEDPDIICLQETKCPEKKLPPEAILPGYHIQWVNGVKDGYAGVALYSKEKPITVTKGLDIEEHDSEGRVITAEYEEFYLVAVYVPNAGQALKTLPKRLKWDKDFQKYLKDLDTKKPVILCGDLNVSHNEIDLANPKTNTKSAGFTKEERDGFTELLKEGFVDSFRHLYPDQTGAYTYWTFMSNARSRNVGWRLDYFVISERFMPHLCDNVIRNKVLGSDHCPVTLFLNI